MEAVVPVELLIAPSASFTESNSQKNKQLYLCYHVEVKMEESKKKEKKTILFDYYY